MKTEKCFWDIDYEDNKTISFWTSCGEYYVFPCDEHPEYCLNCGKKIEVK